MHVDTPLQLEWFDNLSWTTPVDQTLVTFCCTYDSGDGSGNWNHVGFYL